MGKNETIKEPFRLTQILKFEDDGMWTLETKITTADGLDESFGLQPCFLEEFRFPSINDCMEAVKETLGYLLEDNE